ncbi:MAG: hypothetical protein NVSMB66_2450 [Candidatus Doudnabacteria bacterium]
MTETQASLPPKTPKNTKNYTKESAQVLSVAFEMGLLIALPILLFALAGKWFDQKQHTHYYLFVGVGIAVLLTSFMIYKRFEIMVDKLRQAGDLKK